MQKTDVIRNGVAVVTGAGSGLGRALSLGLCAEGLRVVGFGRDATALAETAGLAKGGPFTAMVVDVADFAAVRAAFETIKSTTGPVTLLVNNAAVYPRRDILAETAESFQGTVNINLGGTVAASLAALDQMTESGIGRIINVATFADIAPIPTSAAYAVSKGAARVFSRALVADLGDRFPEIVISDWMPGMLATKMGIPDGLPPEVSAKWGVRLALWHDPSLNGAVFEQAQEILPPQGLKRRILNKVLRRGSAVARRLD